MLEGVDRPVAKVMMANLDLRHLMGIPASATRGRGRKAPLLPFYEDVKAQHPTKVLLVRVRAMPLLHPQECLCCCHAHPRPDLSLSPSHRAIRRRAFRQGPAGARAHALPLPFSQHYLSHNNATVVRDAAGSCMHACPAFKARMP